MVRSDQSPSLLPPGDDQAVYLVLDDFGGRIGQVWRETNVEATDLETVIEDLLDDQFSKPVFLTSSSGTGAAIGRFSCSCQFGSDGFRRYPRPNQIQALGSQAGISASDR